MPEDVRNIVVGAASVIFNGQVLGWTEDALTLQYTHDDLVINTVQQRSGVVARKRVNDDIIVRANLIENTLENMKLLLGINANIQQGDALRTLLGDQSGDLPEGELVVYGKAPNDVNRTFVFYKAVLMEAGEIAYDARNYTKVAIAFQILWHPTYDQRYYITEEYIPEYPTS